MFRLDNVSKTFRAASGEVRALDGVDLEIEKGSFTVIRGPSGSGKTTLLLALGGMQRPTSGGVFVDGRDIYALRSRQRALFRKTGIGFVFQMYHLVPYLTVLENVLLATGRNADRDRFARNLLDRLGLIDRRDHRPACLSAGEKQRAAIARALANKPAAILADEPTGNLDPDSAGDVIGRLDRFRKEGGTVVVVTHGAASDSRATRIIHLRRGRIVENREQGKQE